MNQTTATIIMLMGVSGVGKTTIGQALAQELGWPFYDADDFHPTANVEKMRQGQPLTDDDRHPWLATLHQHIAQLIHAKQAAVVTCSALKQSYRNILAEGQADKLRWVYLKGNYALIQQRLAARAHHFMKADLLASQFATLEEPAGAVVIEVNESPEVIVRRIKAKLGVRGER